MRLTSDEKRLVVTDYFLVEDLAPGGIVNGEGDHKIHVGNVHGNRSNSTRRSTSNSIAISARGPHARMDWSCSPLGCRFGTGRIGPAELGPA
jgi:hypothetical protein